jgi:hypothetical protein
MPRGSHCRKMSDERVNATFERLHGDEAREYYSPRPRLIGCSSWFFEDDVPAVPRVRSSDRKDPRE